MIEGIHLSSHTDIQYIDIPPLDTTKLDVKLEKPLFNNSNTKKTLRNNQRYFLNQIETCPVCSVYQYILYMYTRRVCADCINKYYILDKDNNRMFIGNLGIAGGIQAITMIDMKKVDTPFSQRQYMHHPSMPNPFMYECYIKGIPCIAQENPYGGIIIQEFIHNK